MKKRVEESGLPSLALVFGYIAVKELQFDDRVRILSNLGYGNKEIAKICDTTIGSVAVRKHFINRKRKVKK